MKVTGKDFFSIGIVLLVLIVVLILSTGHEKTRPVPADDKHRPFSEAMEKGADRADVERRCVTCHNPGANPLSRKHPPKEECLICHKLGRAKR